MRLDQYLVAKGYYESRNKAAAAVKNGDISVNGKTATKPSLIVEEPDNVTVDTDKKVYVARSAHKLLKAYDVFDLQWQDKIIADLGASTGGFCQVLLEKGVQKVYAVDIGTAQLHPKLKNDHRIVNLEHTNARFLEQSSFPEPIDCVSADLSFISMTLILPAISRILPKDGEAVILIKPQFEAGKSHLSKSGVVTERKIHQKVLEEIIAGAQSFGMGVKGISFSGLSGESGNREYLLYLKYDGLTESGLDQMIRYAVYEEGENA